MFRVNKTLIGFTKENYAFIQKWKQAFEYTIHAKVDTEIAVNAMIAAMRIKSDNYAKEDEEDEDKKVS